MEVVQALPVQVDEDMVGIESTSPMQLSGKLRESQLAAKLGEGCSVPVAPLLHRLEKGMDSRMVAAETIPKDGFPPLSSKSRDNRKKLDANAAVSNPGLKENGTVSSPNKLGVENTVKYAAVGSVQGVEAPASVVRIQGVNAGRKAMPNSGNSWASLFKDNRSPSSGTDLYEVDVDELSNVCALSAEDVFPSAKAWGSALIGYFAGRFPGKWGISQLIKSWKSHVKHYTHKSGWLVFQFEEEKDMLRILEAGPYFVSSQPLILKPVPEYFNFEDEEMKFMPVWASLHGLPKECWKKESLSKICSRIGKPLRTDKRTAELDGVAFARVLIQVDASRELTKEVSIKLPNNAVLIQKVDFDYYPTFCTMCKCIGHTNSVCNYNLDPKYSKGKGIMADGKYPTPHPVRHQIPNPLHNKPPSHPVQPSLPPQPSSSMIPVLTPTSPIITPSNLNPGKSIDAIPPPAPPPKSQTILTPFSHDKIQINILKPIHSILPPTPETSLPNTFQSSPMDSTSSSSTSTSLPLSPSTRVQSKKLVVNKPTKPLLGNKRETRGGKKSNTKKLLRGGSTSLHK